MSDATFQGANVTLGEMRSVLATLFGVEAEMVKEWLISASITCACSSPDCDGDATMTALMCSRSTVEHGYDEPFMLHMAAATVEAIAQHQNGDENP